MTCYVVPASAAIIHHFMRKKNPSWKNDKHHIWLSLLLYGAAIFGVIDHWWNGELLLFGPHWLADIMLGATISIAIVFAWAIIVVADKPTAARSPA